MNDKSMMADKRLKKYNSSFNIEINPQHFEYIGFVIIIICISISIYMNFAGRSFWIDEAMLSYSFTERSIWNLTSAPFEWDQAAPVMYLYICKSITLIFGNTEFVLRSISIFSYIAVLIMVYLLSKNVFKIKYPILCSAIVANTPFMLRYSNEFKQYMFETAIVLILFYVYYLYKERNISRKILSIAFIVVIWCANPACFFVGGILIYEIVCAIYIKDKVIVKDMMYIAFGVLMSFVIYWYYWLGDIASSNSLQAFWHGNAFSIFPNNLYDLKRSFILIKELFVDYFQVLGYIIFIVSILSLLIGIIKKDRYVFIISLSIFLWLFASSLHKFPIFGRICLFIVPFISILICSMTNNFSRKSSLNLAYSVPMLIFAVLVGGIQYYFKDKYPVYKGQGEPNIVISYIKDNIKDDEKLYVCRWGIPTLKYKNGYQINKIGSVSRDNIIWGEHSPFSFYPDESDQSHKLSQVAEALRAEKCYIFCTHLVSDKYGFDILLEKTKQEGALELVLTADHLYFYTKNIKNLKQFAEYKIVNIRNSYKSCTLTVEIINIGTAYINGTRYDNVVFTSRERNNPQIKLGKRLGPGEATILHFSFDWQDGESFIDLQLKNEGLFWFDELGCQPLRIARPQQIL